MSKKPNPHKEGDNFIKQTLIYIHFQP